MKPKARGTGMTFASLCLAACTALAAPAAWATAPTGAHMPGGGPRRAESRAEPSLGADAVTPLAAGKKVLSVGDSWAYHMEAGMRAVSPGTIVYGAGGGGCGILLPVEGVAPACNQWPTSWPQMMDTYHPDAVELMVAVWDLMPQKTSWDAPAQSLSEPAHRLRFTQNLERAINILSVRNTPVYLMNSPRVHDPYTGAWAQEMNELLEEAARSHPNVHVLNIRDQLCDAVSCPAVLHGINVYDETMHTTPAAEKRLGAWILNEMFQPDYTPGK